MAEMTLSGLFDDHDAKRAEVRKSALDFFKVLDVELDRLDDRIAMGERLCRSFYQSDWRMVALVHGQLYRLQLTRDRLIRTRAALAREHGITAEEVGCG